MVGTGERRVLPPVSLGSHSLRRLSLPVAMRRRGPAASPQIAAVLERQVPQLSFTAALHTADEIQEMVDSPATRLLLVRDDDNSIVGTLTLTLVCSPTGTRTLIEDVVVDEAARVRS
jgi:hypothetical protein